MPKEVEESVPRSRNVTALLRRHPSVSFFILAFALSWGSVWLVITPGEIPAPPDRAEALFPLVYLAMLVGPAVAGILMTAVVSAREGMRAYRERLFRWQAEPRWYAVALLTAPVVLLGTLGVLWLTSSQFRPAILAGGTSPMGPAAASSMGSFLLLGIGIGIGAGLFEELGWTGFVIPRMRAEYGVFQTGLIVGLLWGAWHFLVVFWGSADAFGSVPVLLFLVVSLFAFLPPYRVLMVRIYDHSGSLLLGVIMHASLTASMILLGPVVVGGAAVVYNLSFGSALWMVVALTGKRVPKPA